MPPPPSSTFISLIIDFRRDDDGDDDQISIAIKHVLLKINMSQYGRLFNYESSGPGDFVQQPHSSAIDADSHRESGSTRPLH